MNILLVCPLKEHAEMISMSLGGWFAAKVHPADSFKAATPKLVQKASFDLLVCQDHPETQSLLKYLVSINFKAPIVILAEGKSSHDWKKYDFQMLGVADISSSLDDLHDLILDALKKGLIALHAPDTDFVQVKTELLLGAAPFKSDVFVRLAKDKFVKLFRESQVVEKSDLERFLANKRVEYFHFRKEDASEFIMKTKEGLKKPIEKSPDKLAETVHAVTLQLIHRVGFTPEVQGLVKENMQAVLSSVGKSPKLANMLKAIVVDKHQYISSHSVTLAKVACGIAARMKWPSETTFQKLILASLCHDLALSNQKLAAIRTLEDLERQKEHFKEADLVAYREHPHAAAEMVKLISEVPADVHTIVLQHHERPDGSGFPRKLSASFIAPLSAVFIIAHDLVDFAFEQDRPCDLPSFIKLYKDRYSMGNFKRILAALG